jgi:hypothetical protein
MAMITGMTQIEAQINWVGAHGFNSVVTMGLASEVNDVSPRYRVSSASDRKSARYHARRHLDAKRFSFLLTAFR